MVRLDPDIARTASLLGDPTRATMLIALMDGSTRPATELARLAGVTPQTGSAHLAKLLDGGLVALTAKGRNRYFRLAGRDVARLVESLSVFSRSASALTSGAEAEARGLRYARTCYDHLAGRVGVALTDALVARRNLRARDSHFVLTERGTRWIEGLGIDTAELRAGRRPLALSCIDWSERRPHLAGGLGAALLDFAMDSGFPARVRDSRALTGIGGEPPTWAQASDRNIAAIAPDP
jgi:DNA-binding transcriptional ArsR family regulator